MSIISSSNHNKLRIFENFETLHKEEQVSSFTIDTSVIVSSSSKNFLNRFFHSITNKLLTSNRLSPKSFFNLIKSRKKKLNREELNKQFNNVYLIKRQAMMNQQTALVETLMKEESRINKEIILKEFDFLFIEEADIVSFSNRISKGIKLDWIKNFTRIIPESVSVLLQEAMTLKIGKNPIFDNYVILHYDPYNDGSALTKKEEKQKKDPILFGVIKGSNRLYYIADWQDEYCSLTLKELLNTIGKNIDSCELTINKIVGSV